MSEISIIEEIAREIETVSGVSDMSLNQEDESFDFICSNGLDVRDLLSSLIKKGKVPNHFKMNGHTELSLPFFNCQEGVWQNIKIFRQGESFTFKAVSGPLAI